ncbi:MAG: hypothetical protein JXR68_04780 [Bacteroidales bacterium]|nr:hypothetical protein [Bacteroidales bacterium]
MNTKLSFFLIVVLFLGLSACKDDSNSTINAGDDIVVDQVDDQLVYPMPTPFEVTQMLQTSGTPFSVDIMNPVSNVDNYMQEISQALNLGVYGADLAYASTYNQANEVRDILAAAKKLSDELGLANVMDQNIVERIEQNIQNQDSLYKIVNNTFYNTYDKLNQEQKGAVSLLVITGAWIESIYLATQIAISSQDNSILMIKVAEQKYNVNTLLPLLNQYTDNAEVASMIPVIQNFKTIFDKVQVDSLGDVTIDQAIFDEITDYSVSERNKIIAM